MNLYSSSSHHNSLLRISLLNWLFTSAKKIVFMAISLFVSRIMQKLLELIFTKFGGKVSMGHRRND